MRLTVICLVLFFFTGYAQNKNIRRADAYFEVGQFRNAVKYYERGLRKNNSWETYYKLSKCYRKLNRPDLMVLYLQKIKEKGSLSAQQTFELGQALKMVGRYGEAKQLFQNLLKTNPDNMEYLLEKHACDSAMVWNKKPAKHIKILNLDFVNTEYSEISPFPFENSLIFSSNREKFVRNRAGNGDELPYYDLYKIPDINDPKILPFASSVNSKAHESSASLDEKGSKVFFTQHTHQSGDSLEDIAHLKIFYLENNNGKWKNPHTFVFNDSTSSFAHPFISRSGKMFFFVSDMKGGMGGTDIYFCMLKDSLWSAPVNLGPPINTPGNEIYPYLDEQSNTLYFSSDYHPGLGGYDIFKAVEKDGEFQIQNLKPPVNSSYDDFGLVYNFNDSSSAYFVSNRPGGKGLEDIYKLIFLLK